MSRRMPPVPELPEELDPALLAALTEARELRRDRRRAASGRAAVMIAAARARDARAGAGRLARWRRRGVVAGLSLAGANLVVGGLVAMAAGAQPDSFLYGVKRAAEAAKLSLTLDSQDRAHLQLELADRRAAEAQAMAHTGHAGLALDAARDATTLVRQAAATLGEHPSADNAQALQHASGEAMARLEEVFAALENGTDPGAAEAARSLDADWSNGLGHGASDQDTTGSPDRGNAADQGSQGGGAGQDGGQSGAGANASPEATGSAGSSGRPGSTGDHGAHPSPSGH